MREFHAVGVIMSLETKHTKTGKQVSEIILKDVDDERQPEFSVEAWERVSSDLEASCQRGTKIELFGDFKDRSGEKKDGGIWRRPTLTMTKFCLLDAPKVDDNYQEAAEQDDIEF